VAAFGRAGGRRVRHVLRLGTRTGSSSLSSLESGTANPGNLMRIFERYASTVRETSSCMLLKTSSIFSVIVMCSIRYSSFRTANRRRARAWRMAH